MLLGEPSRTAYDLNFRVGDVPVRVHPMFWLVALLIGGRTSDPKLVLIWIAVLFLSILIHELGHVLAYRYYGRSAHVVLYAMGGLAISSGGYGSFSGRAERGFSRIVISLAGPVAGFLLAAVVVAILFAINRSIDLNLFGLARVKLGMGPDLFNGDLATLLSQTIDWLLFVNIFWGLVNLLPIYPLDGGQVSRELFLMGKSSQAVHHSLMLSMIASIAVAAYFVKLELYINALLFGLLAYQSYQAMQLNRGGGYGGGRGW